MDASKLEREKKGVGTQSMGENTLEQELDKRLPPRWRRRIASWLDPTQEERLRELEEKILVASQRVQRVMQQNRALLKDVGKYTADAWANLMVGDYNPEEIEYSEYKKMLNYDAQVIAGFDLIQMGVLMKPWRIVHTDEKIVETLTNAFKRMRMPNIRDAMKEMLKAIAYGFTATEIVFEEWQGQWIPRRANGLKTFDVEQIKFYSDPYGNLLKCEQRIGGDRIELPLNRTLIWSHEREWGNWYGKALLRGCYKPWFIKDAMLKFANIAYERFGSPILLGIARNISDMEQVAEAIEHLFARSQGVLVVRDKDDPTRIEVIESKRTEMPFDRYIRYQDEMILRRMLIGQRIFEGGGGTYGPKVPLDIIFMRFEDFQLELMAIMNHLLQIITDLNWQVDEYPQFKFAPLTTMDQVQITQKIYDALDRGVIYVDEPFVREDLAFPPASKEISQRMERDREKAQEEPEETEIAASLPGRYFAGNHARWLVEGWKKLVVSSRPYSEYGSREIYIVGDDGAHGVMIEGESEGPYAKDIREKMRHLHRISDEEWNAWWPGEEEFWIWAPRIRKRFKPPLKLDRPRGAQVYIRRVKPRRNR